MSCAKSGGCVGAGSLYAIFRLGIWNIAKGENGANFKKRNSAIANMNIQIRIPFVMLERTSFNPPEVVCMTSEDADPRDFIRLPPASPAPDSASFKPSPSPRTISEPPFVALAIVSPIAVPMFSIKFPLPFELILCNSLIVLIFEDMMDNKVTVCGGLCS